MFKHIYIGYAHRKIGMAHNFAAVLIDYILIHEILENKEAFVYHGKVNCKR